MSTRMVCWHCGGWVPVEFDGELERVMDVVALTEQAGMILKEDKGRALVFCAESCARANKIDGKYRATSRTARKSLDRRGDIISSVYLLPA